MPDAPPTLDEHLAALRKEYGQYVAVNPILIDGVLAFTPGHQVPASHVERGVVSKDDVAKAGTKAAEHVPAAAAATPKKD